MAEPAVKEHRHPREESLSSAIAALVTMHNAPGPPVEVPPSPEKEQGKATLTGLKRAEPDGPAEREPGGWQSLRREDIAPGHRAVDMDSTISSDCTSITIKANKCPRFADDIMTSSPETVSDLEASQGEEYAAVGEEATAEQVKGEAAAAEQVKEVKEVKGEAAKAEAEVTGEAAAGEKPQQEEEPLDKQCGAANMHGSLRSGRAGGRRNGAACQRCHMRKLRCDMLMTGSCVECGC